jgi:hypothetical protein
MVPVGTRYKRWPEGLRAREGTIWAVKLVVAFLFAEGAPSAYYTCLFSEANSPASVTSRSVRVIRHDLSDG